MITRRLVTLALAALVAAAGASAPARAASTPAIAAFESAFASINDYTFNLRSHEQKGGASQDRVYAYSFMKPHFAKTLIQSGDGSGSGGVWAGGDQVSGHQGGFLSGIHLKISLHDGRAISLLGYTIPDGLLQNIVALYRDTPGTLTQRASGNVDGVPTTMVELVPSNPSSLNGATRCTIYFSNATHMPVRNIFYNGGTTILDQSFNNVKTNVGLSQNDFPF
jgi:outer membrane lipoprotein-sorting protein